MGIWIAGSDSTAPHIGYNPYHNYCPPHLLRLLVANTLKLN